MTIDERILFLVQSTESLHATVQENTAQIQQNSKQIAELIQAARIDGENIKRLANIAAAHESRLDDLEGGQNG